MINLSSPKLVIGIALATGIILYIGFLYFTSLVMNPFILFGAIIFILYPLRRESFFVRRVLLLVSLTFALWLIREVAALLVPFIVAFILAYILDPIATWLHRKKIPRFISATVVVLAGVGLATAVSIFVFPIVFSQLDDMIRAASTLVANVNNYIESRQFYRSLSKFGIPTSTLKEIVQTEIVPRLKGIFETLFHSLLYFLQNISGLATQVINIILVPILLFYFLKDFDKLKRSIILMLKGKNERLLHDMFRINKLIQAYVGGQAIAALLIAIIASTVFAFFGIPYAIVLGIFCGLLNPIPYIGIFASLLIGIITLLIVGRETLLSDITIIAATVFALHFLDTYFLQPRIVGKKIGLHPLVLIASLFVFGYFFGVLGLLLAVPTTAVLVMFFNDWMDRRMTVIEQTQGPEAVEEVKEESR